MHIITATTHILLQSLSVTTQTESYVYHYIDQSLIDLYADGRLGKILIHRIYILKKLTLIKHNGNIFKLLGLVSQVATKYKVQQPNNTNMNELVGYCSFVFGDTYIVSYISLHTAMLYSCACSSVLYNY
jgi:hypothetical protein